MFSKFRTLVTVWMLLTSAHICLAQNKGGGIQFHEKSWEDVIKLSKETGKPVMIDVFTTWCPPCKRMDKEVFPVPEVGNKYNSSFICYRIDAEKGAGIKIKERYQVSAYPTYLFIDKDGMLLHRGVGFHPPENFLKLADEALTKTGNAVSLHALQQKYEGGNRDHEFLQTYIKKLTELGLKKTRKEVLEVYVNSLSKKDISNENTIGFILKHLVISDSRAFDILIDRQPLAAAALRNNAQMYPDIIRNSAESKLSVILSNSLIESLMQATSEKDSALFTRTIAKEKKLLKKEPLFPYSFFSFGIQYHVSCRDTSGLLELGKTFLEDQQYFGREKIEARNTEMIVQFMHPFVTGLQDSSTAKNYQLLKQRYQSRVTLEAARCLDLTADACFRSMHSTKALEHAIVWSRNAIALLPEEPRFYQTLASLYYKTGKHDLAISTQQSAIAIARREMMADTDIERYNKVLEAMRTYTYKSN